LLYIVVRDWEQPTTTQNTFLLGVIYIACIQTPLYQSLNEILSAQLHQLQKCDWDIVLKRVTWLWPRPF